MQTTKATRNEGATTGFLESSGQRVRYRVRGDGPPLLLINGVGAPLEYWDALVAELVDFTTIAVDPPGAGRSSAPRGRFGMRDYAGVMDDVLDHLGVESANVLGLSLGGLIAQEFAHRSPKRVEKLVLASTTYGLGSVPGHPRAWAALVNPGRFRSGGGYYRRVAPILYGEQVRDEPALLREHLEIRRRFAPSMRGHFAQLRAASTWSSLPWLWRLEMPVLVLCGSEDQLVPVANARVIAAVVPNGRAEIIEGGSHAWLLQEPVGAAARIREFLLDA